MTKQNETTGADSASALTNGLCVCEIVYTDWFSPGTLPARDGLYLIKYGRHSDCWHMAYWSRDGWYSAGVAADGMPRNEDHQLGSSPCYWWRGLTHNALAEPRP